MKRFFIKHQTLLFLPSVLAINFFLHFYDLVWGAPYYFHPDERNILYGLTQLTPQHLNPHFFAYGALPIYVTYVISLIFTHGISPIPFETGILVLRGISALLATGVVWLLFSTGTKLWNKKTGIIASLLWTFSTGAIQYAHFGTFEMWLTFFSLLLFLLLCVYIRIPSVGKAIGVGTVTGILIATKVSSLVFIPLLFVICVYQLIHAPHKRRTFIHALIITAISLLVFVLSNPFVFLDKISFLNSMTYESGVALGTLSVFYTGGFVHTIPLLYQIYHVFPFISNPITTVIFIACFFVFILLVFKKRSVNEVLLAVFFLILFITQGILYVKWTRYMIPTLPFMYLILAPFLSGVFIRKRYQKSTNIFSIFFVVIAAVFSLSFFITAYVESDTRVAAAKYVSDHISPDSVVLSEVYDLGIVPFNQYLPHITLFNFYDLENDPALPVRLPSLLASSDYIILPSQRIVKSRLDSPDAFPQGSQFYENLMNGKIGFSNIYQTPCSVFCEVAYLGDPVYHFEETATVFDRPTLFIFKKQ